MADAEKLAWVDARIGERAEENKQRRLQRRDPKLTVIDAGKFANQLAKLAQTLIYCVEREGMAKLPGSTISEDIPMILRQLLHTYNLILYLNAEDRRDKDPHYRQSYSFVILPLVRTMIDGFYNCTAMLDDPSRARIFRISGLYRLRESIKADEIRYSQDLGWQEQLAVQRESYEHSMRLEGFIESDLDNRLNEWPLLGKYLGQKPDTPHKQLLRKLTLGFWKEYSSISHASYDGLIGLFPFIARDVLPIERRTGVQDAGERHIFMHIGRAAALLLSLLTEIQLFFHFEGPARIDERLSEIWSAMVPIYEVNELYLTRYERLLREHR